MVRAGIVVSIPTITDNRAHQVYQDTFGAAVCNARKGGALESFQDQELDKRSANAGQVRLSMQPKQIAPGFQKLGLCSAEGHNIDRLSECLLKYALAISYELLS